MTPLFPSKVSWCVQTARHRDRYNHYITQWYEHLHTILYNPFFIGLGVCVIVGQCELTMRPIYTNDTVTVPVTVTFNFTLCE